MHEYTLTAVQATRPANASKHRFGRRLESPKQPAAQKNQTLALVPQKMRGGQPGNHNRLVHGHYSENPDLYAPRPKSLPRQREDLLPEDQDILTSFEVEMKNQGKRPKTVVHYVNATRAFFLFCKQHAIPLRAASQADVYAWIKELREERGYASASLRNRAIGLKMFYKWLMEEPMRPVKHNPFDYPRTLKMPRVEGTRKDVVPAELMEKLLTQLEQRQEWRNAAIVCILYDTGIRAGELAQSHRINYTPEDGTLYLPPEITKNHEPRWVHIEARGQRNIARYLRTKRGEPEYLINGHKGQFTPNGLYQCVRGLFARVGSPVLIGPHDLRHSFATHAARQGAPTSVLRRLGGWKTDAMARHYAHDAEAYLALQAHHEYSPLAHLQDQVKREREEKRRLR